MGISFVFEMAQTKFITSQKNFTELDAERNTNRAQVKRRISDLTFSRRMTYIYVVPHREPPDFAFYIFIQQIYVLNILNMLHTLRFFLFKMPFIS
jgi:hypothetical protein